MTYLKMLKDSGFDQDIPINNVSSDTFEKILDYF